jgi:hypothetical protein
MTAVCGGDTERAGRYVRRRSRDRTVSDDDVILWLNSKNFGTCFFLKEDTPEDIETAMKAAIRRLTSPDPAAIMAAGECCAL